MKKKLLSTLLSIPRLIERVFSARSNSGARDFSTQFTLYRGREKFYVRIRREHGVVDCYVLYPTEPPTTYDVMKDKMDAVKRRFVIDLLLNCLMIVNPRTGKDVRDALIEILLTFKVHTLDTTISYYAGKEGLLL